MKGEICQACFAWFPCDVVGHIFRYFHLDAVFIVAEFGFDLDLGENIYVQRFRNTFVLF